MSKKRVRFSPGWFAALLLFWIALTGGWDGEQLLVGAVICYIALYLRYSIVPPATTRTQLKPLGIRQWLLLVWMIAGYLRYLFIEVVKANVQVAIIVLNPQMPLSPSFIAYHPRINSDWGRVLLGNSISLTPGTLTVELEDGDYLVHALTVETAENLPGWAAEEKVLAMEDHFQGDGQ